MLNEKAEKQIGTSPWDEALRAAAATDKVDPKLPTKKDPKPIDNVDPKTGKTATAKGETCSPPLNPRGCGYRGTSLTRNHILLGPCSRAMPKAVGLSWEGGQFLMSEVPPTRLTPNLKPQNPNRVLKL